MINIMRTSQNEESVRADLFEKDVEKIKKDAQLIKYTQVLTALGGQAGLIRNAPV